MTWRDRRYDLCQLNARRSFVQRLRCWIAWMP
jgi:hypothetical protein